MKSINLHRVSRAAQDGDEPLHKWRSAFEWAEPKHIVSRPLQKQELEDALECVQRIFASRRHQREIVQAIGLQEVQHAGPRVIIVKTRVNGGNQGQQVAVARFDGVEAYPIAGRCAMAPKIFEPGTALEEATRTSVSNQGL